MKSDRRAFLKRTGLAGLGVAGAGFITSCTSGASDETDQASMRTAAARSGSDKSWQEDPEWQKIRYGEWGGPGVDPRPGAMDQILLKDYAPKSSIVEEVTVVERAAHPVIDMHLHHYPGRVEGSVEEALDEWVQTMDEVGVETSVILTVATGERFRELADLYLKRHPDRFQLWCGVDLGHVDEPDFPEQVVEELERCYEAGARGIGEVTDKGEGLARDRSVPREKRLHLDDSRLDGFWSKAAELNMPANIHIADHPSAWEPLDIFQERTPDYQHFNLHGLDIVSHSELIDSFSRVVERHPETTFIACHLANLGHDLGRLRQLMDQHDNLHLDISARDYEMGRRPRASLKFLTDYSDRVLFGTDMGMKRSMYQAWWRLLETADEYMVGRVWWPYYGLDLPDDLLQKLYHDNAERLLNRDPVSL